MSEVCLCVYCLCMCMLLLSICEVHVIQIVNQVPWWEGDTSLSHHPPTRAELAKSFWRHALYAVIFFIPMKILIFWPKYWFLDVRILKLENQTWQLCICEENFPKMIRHPGWMHILCACDKNLISIHFQWLHFKPEVSMKYTEYSFFFHFLVSALHKWSLLSLFIFVQTVLEELQEGGREGSQLQAARVPRLLLGQPSCSWPWPAIWQSEQIFFFFHFISVPLPWEQPEDFSLNLWGG